MKLSAIAFAKIEKIYQSIINHPFNQELMKGELNPEIFCYYIEQDKNYLQDFSRVLAQTAAKANNSAQIQLFLQFALYTSAVESEVVHKYFYAQFKYQESKKITPANMLYTKSLLATAAFHPFELSVAAVLPCFWIYQRVGEYIAKNQHQPNPYDRWITTYSSSEFSAIVEKAIATFDEIGEKASVEIKTQMLKLFVQSSYFEYLFWDDAYNLKSIDF